MMFGGQKAINPFRIFRWNQREEQSLTTGLLHDVPPEIELSHYGRIPSPGSESPSGLLNGESPNVTPIADLDLFFERLYSYYCEKGLWCIITKWVVELLSLSFTICFSGFFLLYVDWNGLRNAKCGMDAVESGIKPCDLVKEALHEHPLTPFTLSKAIIVGYLALFSIYWVFCFLRFFAQLKDTLGIRQFYYNSLHVTDNEIQTMPWATVLEKVVQLQSSQPLCVVKDLSIQDIVMRLMRKENYLIGMLNKGVLAFPISQWIPGAGPTVKCGPNGVQYRLVLTKTLEWTLNWCVLQSMFDRNFCVRRDFMSNRKMLKKRLIIVGITMLLLSPFLVIFMLVYLFLRHAEQFYNHPSTASSRRWSNLSRWMYREFNEVDHLFKHRINSSVVHASEYLKQFPSPIISIIAKFVSFVSGGFAAVLIIIAFLEESLLEGHILGRNLFWYAAVFGTITAISRAAITDELLVLNPESAMSLVVQHTHYMPKRWRGKENTEKVRIEFETLFQYTGMMLLEEMASIFLTPFLLIFVVPKRVDDMLQFIAEFTVDIEGVGHVCSFSTFDFQHHGNSKYASPYDASRNQRSSQGKMEKSFLSFQNSYPSWEPGVQGKQFLLKLRTFQEQKLQGLGARYTSSSTRACREASGGSRGHVDRAGTFFQEMPRGVPVMGHYTDSLWLIDSDPRNHPYLLDWYYTSGPQSSSDDREANQVQPCGMAVQTAQEHCTMRANLIQNATRYSEDYHIRYEHTDQSNMEPCTTGTFYDGSILQHQESGNEQNSSSGSRWWMRSNRTRRIQPETSFIDPPDLWQHQRGFGTLGSFIDPPDFTNWYAPGNLNVSISERSEEEEQGWESSSHRLSRTMLVDDDMGTGGDVNLLFDDVYSRPPEDTVVNVNPAGLE